MRLRIHYFISLFVGLWLTTVVASSCHHSPLEESDKELTLLITFSPKHQFRAIEDRAGQDSYAVNSYESLTLFFYDEDGKPAEPYRVELQTGDLNRAMTDGYPIKVRSIVRKVSAVANRAVANLVDLDGISIHDLQILGGADQAKSFLHKVPYVSPPADIKAHPADPDKLVVELAPVPNVARLEISGNIDIPLESQQSTADWIVANKMRCYPAEGYSYTAQPCELPIHYIKDFTIRGIYINNYKLKPVSTRRRYSKPDQWNKYRGWEGHNEQMHTLFGPYVAPGGIVASHDKAPYDRVMTAGKVDAYQIFPGRATDPEELDHIIVEVEYDLVTQTGYFDAMVYNPTVGDYVYACSRVESSGDKFERIRRFITIRKFLVGEGAGEKSLVEFEPGKIYRIDLSYLNPLFSMNTNPGIKSTNDITEITPRRERTDERPEEQSVAVQVDVSGWTHININTELE